MPKENRENVINCGSSKSDFLRDVSYGEAHLPRNLLGGLPGIFTGIGAAEKALIIKTLQADLSDSDVAEEWGVVEYVSEEESYEVAFAAEYESRQSSLYTQEESMLADLFAEKHIRGYGFRSETIELEDAVDDSWLHDDFPDSFDFDFSASEYHGSLEYWEKYAEVSFSDSCIDESEEDLFDRLPHGSFENAVQRESIVAGIWDPRRDDEYHYSEKYRRWNRLKHFDRLDGQAFKAYIQESYDNAVRFVDFSNNYIMDSIEEFELDFSIYIPVPSDADYSLSTEMFYLNSKFFPALQAS